MFQPRDKPFEKVQQSARPLGKLEPEQLFVLHLGRMPADHVPDMQLGRLVVGQVDHLEPLPEQLLDQLRPFDVAISQLDATEHLGAAADPNSDS